MKTLTAILIASILTTGAAAEQQVIFQTDFEVGAPTGTGQGQIVADGPSRVLFIERTTAGSTSQAFPLDPNALAGRIVTIEASIRAEGVTSPPNPWNGIKAMLVLETGQARDYPQIPLPTGTFARMTRRYSFRGPRNLTKATLILGLEAVSGRVWFDDVRISLSRPAATARPAAEKFTGHDLPRLRGFMHGPQFVEADIRALAEDWNANHIRWQLNWVPMKQAEDWAADLPAFDKWLDGALLECDKALDACEKYSVRVLVDLHTPPGGRVEGGVCRMFQQQKYQDKLIDAWQRIARRYKGRDIVYAYDLVNEPVEGAIAPGLDDWRTLATKATRAIREIDPGKPVVFEPAPWGGPDGFDTLEPLDLDRVIYSFHMYQPHQFTHQGIYDNPTPTAYPGQVAGRLWNRQTLRDAMASVVEFQQACNVQIYVGEFSVIRWAPGDSGPQWLRDVTDIFEEHGWDWSYHAFREWDGWSLEHGPDRNNHSPATEPTDRARIIRTLMAGNRRPPLTSDR